MKPETETVVPQMASFVLCASRPIFNGCSSLQRANSPSSSLKLVARPSATAIGVAILPYSHRFEFIRLSNISVSWRWVGFAAAPCID
jgi:hypothetical protein